MPKGWVSQVRHALTRVNPSEIRKSAERKVRVLVEASSSQAYAAMEDHLAPATLSREKRMEAVHSLVRACDPGVTGKFHLVFLERGSPPPEDWILGHDLFLFDANSPALLVDTVIESREDAALPLARLFPPFREVVVTKTIYKVATENAVFSLLTALPNIVPSIAELPWMAGEFASDTAVLTANQIRMAFLLAAASDRPVGFSEQRNEIGSIVAGAFGWRAAARQLSGKIPFGGGLIPKAAIAFAGTVVVGEALERLYRVGYGLTRAERKEAFREALSKGKEVAKGLLDGIRS